MKKIILLTFIVIALVIKSWGQKNPVGMPIDKIKMVPVEGTKISFPKSSFFIFNRFAGLANKNDAIIFVTELPNDSFEQHAKNFNTTFIKKIGGEILENKAYILDGYKAKQIVFKSPENLKIRMIFFGDDNFCTIITAKHFLNDKKSETEIEYLIKNVRYNKDIKINPQLLSPFIIEGNYNGFKHFTQSQNTHFYTRDGKERQSKDKDPTLAIVYGELKHQSDFDKTFQQFTSIKNIAPYKKIVNGYNAYEGVFDLDNGHLRYYLLIEKRGNFLMVRGTAMEDHKKTIDDFMKFAHQIKFKE